MEIATMHASFAQPSHIDAKMYLGIVLIPAPSVHGNRQAALVPVAETCTRIVIIIDMDEWSPFSASPHEYEAGWVRAKPQWESSKVVKASEFDPAETINKRTDTCLPIQKRIVTCNGITLFGGKTDTLCFEYICQINGNLGEYHGLNLQTRLNILRGIFTSVAHIHEQLKPFICHMDLKADNILLDKNMVPKISDFGLSRCFEGEWTQIMRGSTGTRGYMAPEYINNGDIVSNKSNVYSFGLILLEILTGKAAYSKRSEMSAEEFSDIDWRSRWNFESFSKQMKRSNQTVISCLETGKSTKATSSTVSSTHRAVLDFISSAVALSIMILVLNSGASALAAELYMDQHLYWSNLTDERSDKPRSNRASQNNSSDGTTRAAMANQLTDDEAENYSDPNSSVSERDIMVVAKRSGEWYVATGAAHHATGNPDLITNMLGLENGGLSVHAADGTPMPVRGRGNVVTDAVVLPDVYYVPGLCTNLVSVGQLAGLDYSVGFGRGTCIISSPDGTVVGGAHARGDGLYEVDFLRVPLDLL